VIAARRARVRLADGTVVALEQGAPVPADADPAAVERLARFGVLAAAPVEPEIVENPAPVERLARFGVLAAAPVEPEIVENPAPAPKGKSK
jgi:predicted component of type VI protein secretion system